jgi:hypothetical protein
VITSDLSNMGTCTATATAACSLLERKVTAPADKATPTTTAAHSGPPPETLAQTAVLATNGQTATAECKSLLVVLAGVGSFHI